MADPDNPGQFGNREDTQEQAQAGGEATSEEMSSYDDGMEPTEEDDETESADLPADDDDLGDEDADEEHPVV